MANGFKIDVKGLDKVLADINSLAKEVRIDASKGLNKFGYAVEANAKQLVASNSSDEGALLRSISAKASTPKTLEVEINVTADYAAYIEFGTRKYAAKYVGTLPAEWKKYAAQFKGSGGGTFDEMVLSIFAWVKRKGLRLNPKIGVQEDSFTGAGGTLRKPRKKKKQTIEDGQQQLAYIIAKKIMVEGIPAKPFLYPSVINNTKDLVDNMKKLVSK